MMQTGPLIIQTLAQYKPDQGKFHVSLSMLGQNHIEIMDEERWNDFIDHLDKKIELGGFEISLINDEDERAAEGIRSYLRKVDRAYKATGSTDFLPED